MYQRSFLRFCPRKGKYYSRFNVIERVYPAKRPTVTEENQYDLLSEVVTPWWHIDYSQQLLLKKKWCRQVIEKLKSNKLHHKFRTVIHDVLPSPVIESYRNKDEFSVRTGIDGNDKTVGFFIGSPAEGKTVCVPPTKLITLKEDHIHLSQVYQNLIRSSPLKACHDLHDGGFWRNLVVRSNSRGEIMVIVVTHPQGASEPEVNEAKEQIKYHFLKAKCNITSLYFQLCPNVRCSNDVAAYDLLHGDGHLYESYDDILVRISPDSFAQINTEAAVVMYRKAIDILKVDNRSTLLDLCCGIGAFSLIASKSVRGCVGIDYISQSIDDANFNAKYNEITNCHFIVGRIERNLRDILSGMASDVAPIINPGRSGINKRVVSMIRQMRNIQRFVYVACRADSTGTMNNLIDFCSSSFDSSRPFALTEVYAVDLFPQTNHCELLLYFER